jgi:DegV family protein with EDD domain
MGFGWIVVEAADLALGGMHLEPLAAYAERRRADQRVLALLETLEYLRRGGRIGRTSAFLGSALQITPIVAVRDGGVQPVERVRTMRRALERLLVLAGAEAPFDRLAVLHLGSPAGATDLADRLAAVHPGIPIVRSQVGTVIGTYGGPGVLGFAGLVTPRDLLST